MYIRQATEADVALLVDLGRRTFYDAFAADNTPTDMAQYLTAAFAPEKLHAELSGPGAVFWLAYPDPRTPGQPIGYAQLQEYASAPCITGTLPIEIKRLYLDQRAIGQGYGSQLMQACLDYALHHRFETIWLGVWERNYRARRFYARWGFQEVGTQAFVLGTDIQTDKVLVRPVSPPYSPAGADGNG